MNVRMIVPRRADGGHRDRLWKFCRWYWSKELPHIEIIEGHHDIGAFNRSAAINQAAEGEWDVAVIVDADVIVDAEQITDGVDLARTSGKMVLPFRQRRSVNRDGTRRILSGYHGAWDRWVEETQDWNVSTCVIVPRGLWGEIGGFDERFVGWGCEDEMFFTACLALRGEVLRFRGDAWHLHHPSAPWRDAKSPDYRAACLLLDRYLGCVEKYNRRRPDEARCFDPYRMRRLLAEPRTADQIVVVCLTNGTRDTLTKTIHSADEMLAGPIGRKIIAADGCHPRFDGWDTVPIKGGGYTKATRAALDAAVGSGQPWVFFLEDDFTFPAPIDLAAMQQLANSHPELVQLVLLRQAWYDYEKQAGGIIEAKPEAFIQRDGYIEHRDGWWQNPYLTRRSVLAEHQWPITSGSERAFGNLILKNPDARMGVIGQIGDPPRCIHIGEERAGGHY